MRCIIFWAAFFMILICASCKPTSDGADERNLQNAETPKKDQAKLIKVLVRRAEISDLAMDGAMFMDGIYRITTTVASPLKEFTILSSVDSVEISEDERSVKIQSSKEKATPEPNAWKKDPKAFDFVVYWEMNSKEQTKYSFNEELKVTVEENWKLELVTDPKVVKTWNCSYVLTGGSSFTTNDKEIDQVAGQQTEKVIAPARGPILKEIRAFINANSAKNN